MKSCVTISLVKEAEGGPFVFWHDLEGSMRQAATLGFDAVEIFAPSPEAVDAAQVRSLLDELGLNLAAVGTGAGWVIRKLCLTSPDAENRDQAKAFIRSIIDMGGPFEAPAIIGSMQGRWGGDVSREQALAWLGEACAELGDYARSNYGIPLIYEPLNRYETNLITTMQDGAEFLDSLGTGNVVLLADLFHMNIEEPNVADGIRQGGTHIGHVHFVDSNRRPAGCGHTEFGPIFDALREISYDGYLSAEALPWPNPSEAAKQTIESFRMYASEK